MVLISASIYPGHQGGRAEGTLKPASFGVWGWGCLYGYPTPLNPRDSKLQAWNEIPAFAFQMAALTQNSATQSYYSCSLRFLREGSGRRKRSSTSKAHDRKLGKGCSLQLQRSMTTQINSAGSTQKSPNSKGRLITYLFLVGSEEI